MKKSITAIFFFSLLLCSYQSTSQPCDSIPFQHIYFNIGYHESHVKNFSFTNNNDILLIGDANQNANVENHDAWMMRTTFHGTPLWSKVIGTSADETVNSIKVTKDGGVLFVGSTKYNSQYDVGWLGKVDANQNPQWSIALNNANGKLSQAIELANGDFVAVGSLYLQYKGDGNGNITDWYKTTNFIIRVDKNGKLIWQRSFYHSGKDRINKIQQITDKNFLVTGNVLDSDVAYIIKLNSDNGDVIWMNQYINTQNFNFTRIDENSNGTFRYKTGNKVYYMDASGNFIKGGYEISLTATGTGNNGQIVDVGPVNANEVYYANIKGKPVLFSVNNIDTTVTWAHTYIQNASGLSSLGDVHIFENNIYMSGLYITDKLSDNYDNDETAYLLKATLNGETYCSNTTAVAFKISNISANSNISYSWTDEGAVTPNYITLYSKNIQPKRTYDCVKDCCSDTAINFQDQLCDNSAYKLPDGTIVSQPGFYISRLNTLMGCDSIIYTNLSIPKKIQLPLVADTCMINGIPVTFNLPVDSTVNYRWQDGNTHANYTVDFPGKYWVTAVSNCYAAEDTVNVFSNCEPDVFMPSAFTPNNDGLNDIFRIPQINAQHLLSFNIYNRYGQLIFHSENNSEGWDGSISNKPQPAGTYIYIIKYIDLAGKLHLLKGTVVLVR